MRYWQPVLDVQRSRLPVPFDSNVLYPINYSVISCALVTFTGVEKVEQDYEQYEQFSARSFLNLRYHYNCVIVLIELILDLQKTSSFIYMIISFSNILSDIPSDKYQVANGILRM